MKKNGTAFVLLELILAAFAVVCVVMMVRSRIEPARKSVAVIVEDSENDMWTSLKEGAREAAKEKNTDLRFVTTGTFENEADEIRAIDDAVSDGCDGLLVFPISEKAVRMIRQRSYKIPLMFIFADSKYDVRHLSIDFEDAGRRLAEMITDDNGSGRSIGFIVDKRNSRAARLLKKGIDSGLKGRNYKEMFLRKGANEDFIRTHKPDVLVCLDEDALSTAARLSGANRLSGVRIYGCGIAPNDVYQLDVENINGLVYPDMYRLGYYALTEMAQRVHGNITQPESRVLKAHIIRKRDIFKNEDIISTFSRK